MSAAVSLLGGDAPTASAIDLYAKPSPDFSTKLHETIVTLLKAASAGPVAQANSLGAEDMVITHLINAHQLPIGVFVLDTGALHAESLALLERLQAQHHGVVALVTRCEQAGWVERRASRGDQRLVEVHLTPAGRALGRRLARLHRDELGALRAGRALASATTPRGSPP